MKKIRQIRTSCSRIVNFSRKEYSFLKWKLSLAPEKLKAFKNIHKGQDCFIIGNGPSLNDIPILELENYYKFGLNKIFLLTNKNGLNLNYYVAVNSFVIRQSISQIEKIRCPKFLSFSQEKYFLSDNFFSLYDKPFSWKFYTDISMGISQGYTVTFTALQIAYFMGFKRVFLVGVDHNYDQSGMPNEVQLHLGKDKNHFDPSYFENEQWNLADLPNSEVSYSMAKAVFTHDNRIIYNANLSSKLEVFEKMTFEQAVNLANPIE